MSKPRRASPRLILKRHKGNWTLAVENDDQLVARCTRCGHTEPWDHRRAMDRHDRSHDQRDPAPADAATPTLSDDEGAS